MLDPKEFINQLSEFGHALLIIESVESNTVGFIQEYCQKIIKTLVKDSALVNELCNKLKQGHYYDFVVLDGRKETIKKEDILQIQNQFSRGGLELGNIKFYVLKHFENATKSAVNSLLKFLEEPTENTFCIITTANENLILETIISRCERLRLPMATDKVEELVSKYRLNEIQQKLFVNSFSNVQDFQRFLESENFNVVSLWLTKMLQVEQNVNQEKVLWEQFKNWDYNLINLVLNCLVNCVNNQQKLVLLNLIADLKLNPVKTLIFFKVYECLTRGAQ